MEISLTHLNALREALDEARRALTEEIDPSERAAIVAFIKLQYLLLDRRLVEAACAA
jgi:hypothetical protein